MQTKHDPRAISGICYRGYTYPHESAFQISDPKEFTKEGNTMVPSLLTTSRSTRLEEMLRATMTQSGLCEMVRRHMKHCQNYQFNKQATKKCWGLYGYGMSEGQTIS